MPSELRKPSTHVTWMLTAVLVATLAVSGAPASEATGTLAITTDPAGATVYVDGEMAGVTPLSVSTVASGDHRVRVVKSGYLDNGRLVTVAAGKSSTVTVKLTRNDAGTTAAAPVLGGGGMKKWLIIGAAAGGGAAAYVLATGNAAPTAGTVTVSPANTFVGDTVTFSVNGASDPDGDGLSYAWDFGDGATGTGQQATHAYGGAGTFTATVTVSDGKKSATASGSVAVKTNAAPSAGTITASASPALAGTTITFTASGASDPDGDTLTYSWNFGDGTTGTGQSVNKSYTNAGTYAVTLTVRDPRNASATTGGNITIRSLAATWVGKMDRSFDTTITLTHSGTSLSGTYRDNFGLSGTVSGSINASTRAVSFTVTVPTFAPFSFSGTVSGDFNALNGTVNGSGFSNGAWNLTRQ